MESTTSPKHADFDLERVLVVGTSGAGKTTLARKLAVLRELRHVELDSLYWMPRWEPRPLDEFRTLVEDVAAGERWVVDGNYPIVRDILWGRATDVVWLDHPFPLVFWRTLSRTLRRVATREEIFGGNRESLRRSFLSRSSILLWVIQTFPKNRSAYTSLQRSGEFPGIRYWVFDRSFDANAFLADVASARR